MTETSATLVDLVDEGLAMLWYQVDRAGDHQLRREIEEVAEPVHVPRRHTCRNRGRREGPRGLPAGPRQIHPRGTGPAGAAARPLPPLPGRGGQEG